MPETLSSKSSLSRSRTATFPRRRSAPSLHPLVGAQHRTHPGASVSLRRLRRARALHAGGSALLAVAGVAVLPGLSAPELAVAEATLPPDLRYLLALGLPAGDDFPEYCSPTGLRPPPLRRAGDPRGRRRDAAPFSPRKTETEVAAPLSRAGRGGRRVGRRSRAAGDGAEVAALPASSKWWEREADAWGL